MVRIYFQTLTISGELGAVIDAEGVRYAERGAGAAFVSLTDANQAQCGRLELR